MSTSTFTLTSDEQHRLVSTLSSGNYDLRDVDHARIAGKANQCTIVLYNSGKLVLQGKGSAEWQEFVLEPEILQRTVPSPSSSADSGQAPLPRIGIDESGKGDFFGGMTIAAFRLTDQALNLVQALGIQDSKRIKSDDKIHAIASALNDSGLGNCEILPLPPETYNRLVKKMGSVNRVLAWAHATVLENLLERHPDTSYAIADQFGPEHQIQSALKTKGKAITLKQRHKAESDPAVAAASILARDAFVTQLKELATLTGCRLPLGATHVRPSAEEIVRRAGPEILTRIAKTHFRTTRQVLQATGHDPALLGTPEPKVWKRK
jgi:ribonuclease HIII